jgi:co-chaperonin GroES (HSP10)
MSEFSIVAKNDYIIAETLLEGSDKPFETVDNSQKNQYLQVVGVGKAVDSCKVGDKILPYGQEFQAFAFKGKQYIVLTSSQVIGVFK